MEAHWVSNCRNSAPAPVLTSMLLTVVACIGAKINWPIAAGTAYAARSFNCSRCDASFADLTRCKQHCNHPASYCNRGKAREDFARVISVEVLFRESERDVGGGRMRQYSDRDGQPNDDLEPPSSWTQHPHKVYIQI